MINAYLSNGTTIQKYDVTMPPESILAHAIWIDLYNPTVEEEHWIESTLALDIPTREEMQEIEITSRLYKEKSGLYMTATMLANSDTDTPLNDAVTFVLSEKRLITIRYIEPQPFKMFMARINRLEPKELNPLFFLISLLDATIDRIADILERVGHHLDDLGHVIFHAKSKSKQKEKVDYKQVLHNIGSIGDIGARCWESLVSFSRLLTFLSQAEVGKRDHEAQIHLMNISKDIGSLSDYVNFLSSKVNFLLDATLGMINIEQSNIIKIFSVAAVMFLPPTLIASIYGMNFQFLPELHFKWGYPLVLVLMLLSAWVPFRYFKHRDWL